jgi:hypothetical protein
MYFPEHSYFLHPERFNGCDLVERVEMDGNDETEEEEGTEDEMEESVEESVEAL